MEDLLRPFKNAAKLAATWVVGRGAVITAVAAVTAFVAPKLAMIALVAAPLGMAFSSLNTQILHSSNEKKLLANYRDEIGAALGIEPEVVTVEHMHLLAEGNDRMEMRPNRLLKQALDRNDTTRINWLASHAVAGLMALGVALNLFSDGAVGKELVDEYVGTAEESVETVTEKSDGVFSEKFTRAVKQSLAVSTTTATLAFMFDNSIGYFGKKLLGLNQPTMADQVSEMSKGLRKGKDISKAEVFSVFVQADEHLSDAIKREYRVNYANIPPYAQEQIAEKYGADFHLDEVVELINGKHMVPQELAFVAQGERSGVPLKTTREVVDDASSAKGLSKEEKAQRKEKAVGREHGVVMQSFLDPVSSYVAVGSMGPSVKVSDKLNSRFDKLSSIFSSDEKSGDKADAQQPSDSEELSAVERYAPRRSEAASDRPQPYAERTGSRGASAREAVLASEAARDAAAGTSSLAG